MRLLDRLHRLGLQRRIMLLVTVGLATMFAVGGSVGLSAIDEAASLVFRERLATAYSTVAMLERDLDRLASDISLAVDAAGAPDDVTPASLADLILARVGSEDRYPFFSVIGIGVVDADGVPLAEAGEPLGAAAPAPIRQDVSAMVVRPAWTHGSKVPFVDLIVPVDTPSLPNVGGIIVHAVSINDPAPFDPATFTRGGRIAPAGSEVSHIVGTYNVEIVDADGMTVLSIGSGSRAGSATRHLAAMRPLIESRSAAALVDPGDDEQGDGDEAHVMAVVPITEVPLYLVLEQPVDVALELPNRLRERLFLLIGLGFLAALVLAWVTTRTVVKPTEELTHAASRMAGGDLTRPVAVTAQDEIGSLAETLELMRNRLLDAQRQLVEVNRDLELRIEERTARLGSVLRKTISAQEDERHALARELHDETAQTLAALTIALDRARDDVAAGSDQAPERLGEAKAIAERLLAETRRMILGLRPSALDDLGLGPAIDWYAETVMAERGLDTHVRVAAPRGRLPRHFEIALFRIAQEALNNVAKHAQASTVVIRLRHDGDGVELVIEDDGIGFDLDDALARAAVSGGVGLAGMQERVALLGGKMEITSVTDIGTVVRVRVPLAAEEP